MKESLINDIFDTLKKEGIRYAVLRGYLPVSELYTSTDIDLYIAREDMKRVRSYFSARGFKTPLLNSNVYPHVQFFLLTVDGMIKFDLVYNLCFGRDLLIYRNLKEATERIEANGRIQVFESNTALEILLLHICFDKGKIDEHNFIRLNNLVHQYGITSSVIPAVQPVLDEINHDTLTVESFNEKINEVSNAIGSLVHKNRKVFFHKLKTLLVCKLRYFFHKYKNKGIAILGVDGSGKSTTVNQLYDILKDKSVIQYMGFREMETKYGKEWYEKMSGRFRRIQFLLGIYLEMWIRYNKNKGKPYGLVIYDRYPWEAYENAKGILKPIFFIMFRILFPSPAAIYYIYCSAETSFARKDDILDHDYFRIKKQNADRNYLNRRGVVSFDSDTLSTDEIVQGICQDIMKTGLYDYLF